MRRSQLSYYRKRLGEESFRASKAMLHALRSTPDTKNTVFVGGVQRSGTNMLMQVLERSFATDVFHESDERAFSRSELRNNEQIHRLIERSGAPVPALKALCDLDRFRHLLDEFAPAHGIWLVRDYPDVVNSHLALWKKMPYFLGEVLRDPENGDAGWRARGLSEESRATLARLYHSDMDNATACALFWYLRNTLLFDQALESDERVAIVGYEALVAEPKTMIPRLFAFLGLPYHDSHTGMVSATSIRKKPAPTIEPAVQELCEAMQQKLRDVERIPD